jgi:hypothetical protein
MLDIKWPCRVGFGNLSQLEHTHNWFNKHNFVCSININEIIFYYILWACMPCPNVVNMLLMMWKFMMGWENIPSRIHGVLFSKEYYLDKLKELKKVDKNGLKACRLYAFLQL